MSSAGLDGAVVLVTRPEALAGPLAELVAKAGGEALRQPAIEIVPFDDRDSVRERLAGEGPFDIAVFVSVNAVTYGLDVLPPDADGKPLLAAIGPATRRALEAERRCDICPGNGYTSEALLAEPALEDVEGKRIVIVRGKGGRELLFEELDRRGALVHIAEVYERRPPASMPEAIESRLAAGGIDLVTATSVEILDNVVASVSDAAADALRNTQLVTASSRVAQRAGELGFTHPALVADAPDDGALLAAMQAWQTARQAPDSPPPEPQPPEDASMSKPTAADQQPDTAPAASTAPPAPAKSGRGAAALAVLALLLAIAAALGAGYTWKQQQGITANVEALNAASLADARAIADQAEALAASLNADLSAMEARIAVAEELRSAQQRLANKGDDNAAAIDRLSGRIQGTEAAIDTLRGVSATVRQSWVLAQAEYFLVTANDSLQLSGNPDVALAALLNADARLQELGDPGLSATRAALGQEIAALRAMPKPDIEGIVHELGGLAAGVDQLNMDNDKPASFGSDVEREAVGESPWQRAWSVVTATVRSTLTVRRSTEDDKAMLAPEDAFFLRRNIELQLEVARLAALRGEAAVYAESLRSARRWLTTWFDPEDSAVISAVDALTRLETQDIKPALPDISGSLRALRAAPGLRGRGNDE